MKYQKKGKKFLIHLNERISMKRRKNRRRKRRRNKVENIKRREEDILKFIYESNQNMIPISTLNKEFKNDNYDIQRAIKNLDNKNFIITHNSQLMLTDSGKGVAEKIFTLHNQIEQYLEGENFNLNAHQIAHILEHQLSKEEIEIMVNTSKKKEKGVSLPDFKLPSGKIVKLDLDNSKIWTKLISIGLFPGQRIHILNRTTSNYLLEIKQSKFAIDKKLAEGIYLTP